MPLTSMYSCGAAMQLKSQSLRCRPGNSQALHEMPQLQDQLLLDAPAQQVPGGTDLPGAQEVVHHHHGRVVCGHAVQTPGVHPPQHPWQHPHAEGILILLQHTASQVQAPEMQCERSIMPAGM